ncbi:hypothetical protein MKX01_010273 [Papaver californicum]|nr:hypothetical protein MKX01_010273 [Papaver californicum]
MLPLQQCNYPNIDFSHRHSVPIRYRKPTIKSYFQPPILVPCNGNRETFEDALRVFVLSDLHTDYSENMSLVDSLSTKRYRKDVLLVAGDVAETYNNFVSTMSVLKDRFKHVFFVPGNPDLWRRSKGEKHLDSLEKLNRLLDGCKGLGVETSPMIVDGLGIIPLFSWYHESFDKEKDITGVRILSLEMVFTFFSSFKDVSLAPYFDAMNEKNQHKIEEIQRSCNQIITFSNFLPRQELCPKKRMLFYPNLHKIIGSDSLEVRIRSIRGMGGSPSACHVFGHTHFCWDAVLQGIRYIQAPLAYPRERRRRMNGGEDWLPFCIYSSAKADQGIGSLSEKMLASYWSDYYSIHSRQPDNTELAPWVAKFYAKRS